MDLSSEPTSSDHRSSFSYALSSKQPEIDVAADSTILSNIGAEERCMHRRLGPAFDGLDDELRQAVSHSEDSLHGRVCEVISIEPVERSRCALIDVKVIDE